MQQEKIKEVLKSKNLRATKSRIEVLEFLQSKRHPIGVEVLSEKFPEVNLATLYRMMTDFTEKGIVSEHDLGHGHVDYEVTDRPHHHHAVCEHCGKIEDVYSCEGECRLKKAVRESSKDFETIYVPNRALFGICRSCSVD